MHNGAWLYVYFYIKSVDIHRTPALTLHHMVTRMVIPLHVWLYIKHMVIHIYLYSNIPLYRMRLCITVYSYTRNFAYIYVYTRHIHVCHRSIHSLSIPT